MDDTAKTPATATMPVPTVGRIVHYVLGVNDRVWGNCHGRVAAAIITAVWGLDCVNLHVILDGANHAMDPVRNPDQTQGLEYVPAMNRWVTSAMRSDKGEKGTWNWPMVIPTVQANGALLTKLEVDRLAAEVAEKEAEERRIAEKLAEDARASEAANEAHEDPEE